MSDTFNIEPLGAPQATPGASVDVQTSYPIQGGGAAPIGGATLAPITLRTPSVDRSEFVWAGGAWGERRAGQRVELALLSDPFSNLTQWWPGQYIARDSSNKTYSTGFWSNLAAYSPEADQELLYRWTVKLSQGLLTNATINVWRRPYGGGEYDTGITIPVSAGQALATNHTDDLTLYTGDELMFATDSFISVQHVQIFAHRLDNS